MAEFAVDVDLSPWQREQAARHVEQTLHMNFEGPGLVGPAHDLAACGNRDCPAKSPPAVALRELAAQVRAGRPVRLRLAGFSKSERVRFSQLLLQTADRPGRDGQDELARVLRRVWTEFDRQLRVPADEYERAEHAGLEARKREAEAARRENARLKRSVVA